MNTEPDTRPLSRAELAHFLEQLERECPPPRCSVIEPRSPRIVPGEPATLLGMGTRVPFAMPALRRVPAAAQVESWTAAVPAALAQRTTVQAPPRTFPDPFVSSEPAVWPRAAHWRLWLVLGVLLSTGLVACLASMPSRARFAHAAHRDPPPLPASPARSRAERLDARASAYRTSATTQQVPESRPAARREAVDLLLAGRTRAALAVYRALPGALLAEPALVRVVRLLERELRECSQQAGSPCGT